MATTLRTAFAATALAAGALYANVALAASATYTLTRATLGNVADSFGTTQQEAGTVTNSAGAAVGYYNITRRVTNGGSTQLNQGGTTLVLFFANPRGGAANSVTAEGSHDFNSGAFLGSVSASSSVFQYLRNADASYTIPAAGQISLTLSWVGSTPSKLP